MCGANSCSISERRCSPICRRTMFWSRTLLRAQGYRGHCSHIQSFIENPFEAVTITRASNDPVIEAIVLEVLSAVGEPLIDQLVAGGSLRGPTEIAVESWLAFVRTACVKWIESQGISRDELSVMCLRAFDCALNMPTAAGGFSSSNVGNCAVAGGPLAHSSDAVGDHSARLNSAEKGLHDQRNFRPARPLLGYLVAWPEFPVG